MLASTLYVIAQRHAALLLNLQPASNVLHNLSQWRVAIKVSIWKFISNTTFPSSSAPFFATFKSEISDSKYSIHRRFSVIQRHDYAWGNSYFPGRRFLNDVAGPDAWRHVVSHKEEERNTNSDGKDLLVCIVEEGLCDKILIIVKNTERRLWWSHSFAGKRFLFVCW